MSGLSNLRVLITVLSLQRYLKGRSVFFALALGISIAATFPMDLLLWSEVLKKVVGCVIVAG